MNTTLNNDQLDTEEAVIATSDCETCGASHVFTHPDDAADYIESHRDIGHVVNLYEVA